ncbi:ABC transporter ATP-binding protein [bacterium]|nr:ABC transporter ATP-binding protein [bacterium]
MPPAILTRDLYRTFSKKRGGPVHTALKNVNIEVGAGEIFGFLGPNGAGKTTLIKILCTLLYPTSGEAYVDGKDVVKDTKAVRRLISMVSGGETSGYGILNVEENIWMFSQFYGIPSSVARERIRHYLDIFGLTADRKTKVNKLSTGMRQKTNIIRGFVTDPKILFLDEPTLGLDVHIAREVRGTIKNWTHDHPEKTVFLTTHYMAEAELLCDRIAIIDRGQIVECDTPAALRRKMGEGAVYRLELSGGEPDLAFLSGAGDAVRDPQLLARPEANGIFETRFHLTADEALVIVLQAAKDRGYKVESFGKREPDLEDLFLKIVGRPLESAE